MPTKSEISAIITLKDNLSGGLKRINQDLKSLSDQVKTYWVGIAAAATAAMVGFQKAWALIDLGAKAKQQEEAFRMLTASYGISANALIEGLKEASAETVNTSNIMKSASMAIFQGISPDKLVDLMEGARAAARVSGESIEDAFNRITEAISTGQTRALKHFGIVVDLEKAYQDYAGSINKTVKELSEEEKIIALTNVSLEQLRDLKERVNIQNKSELEYMQSLTAWWDDMKESMGKALLVIVQAWTSFFNMIRSGVFEALEQLMALIKGMFWVSEKITWLGEKLKIPGFEQLHENAQEMLTFFEAQRAGFAEQGDKFAEISLNIWRMIFKNNDAIAQNTRLLQGNTAGLHDNAEALEERFKLQEQLNTQIFEMTHTETEVKLMELAKQIDAYREAGISELEITQYYSLAIAEIEKDAMREKEKAWEDFFKTQEEMTNEIISRTRELTQSDLENWLDNLDAKRQAYENAGLDFLLISNWYLAEIHKKEQEGLKQSKEILEESKKDIFDWAEFNAQVAADTIDAIREGFSGFFSGVFKGELDSAKDLWDSFLDAMINAYANALAQMAVAGLGFNSLTTGTSGFSNLFGAIGGFFGNLFTPGVPTGLSDYIEDVYSFNPLMAQHGAIVNQPSLVMAGETEPEVIAPVRALLNSRQGGDNITVINVNAIDAASFAEVVRRNPGAITTVVQEGIRNNSSLRHTIRRYSY